MFDFLFGGWPFSGKRRKEFYRQDVIDLLLIVPIGLIVIIAALMAVHSAPGSMSRKVSVAIIILTAIVGFARQIYRISAHKTRTDFLIDEFKNSKQQSEKNKQELLAFVASKKKGQS